MLINSTEAEHLKQLINLVADTQLDATRKEYKQASVSIYRVKDMIRIDICPHLKVLKEECFEKYKEDY